MRIGASPLRNVHAFIGGDTSVVTFRAKQRGGTCAETGDSCQSCALPRCSLRAAVSGAPINGGGRPQKTFAVERGDRIVGGAAACRRLWIVIRGLVGLATVLPDGRRQITDLSTPGDVICPVGAIDGTECWVEALGSSLLCELDLSALMKSDGAAPNLMTNLFSLAHHQLERSNGNLVMLGRYDGMERIYQFLAEITQRIGIECTGGFRVHLPMSREDIADYLGLNAETVSRLLSRVRKTGLVTFISPTEFIVHGLANLEKHLPNASPEPAAFITRLFHGRRAVARQLNEASQ